MSSVSGKLELTDVQFRDNQHVMNVAQRIVTRIGRRVDETCPICDARLEDGSRVNIIAPPLAIDGCSISIRKFAKKSITLDVMARQSNISEAWPGVLKIASACRLNIVISGGTGSGKTTMLNAMSQLIDTGERVVTIEDAAELQLQQPHVVRLETRPANLEGQGEITMRDLVKNALRMRPDRIICGEVRGPEAMDMLQAMNTGHDGSMCTLHANSPREAITRIENMVGMAAANLPAKAIRTQIVGAVHLLLQVSRMRDGVRRVTHVTEVVGMEGEVVTMQDLFTYEYQGEGRDGLLIGAFKPAPVRPYFIKRAAYYGLDRALLAAMQAMMPILHRRAAPRHRGDLHGGSLVAASPLACGWHRGPSRRLQQRIARTVGAGAARRHPTAGPAARPASDASRRERMLGQTGTAWSRLLPRAEALRRRLDQAGLRLNVADYVLLCARGRPGRRPGRSSSAGAAAGRSRRRSASSPPPACPISCLRTCIKRRKRQFLSAVPRRDRPDRARRPLGPAGRGGAAGGRPGTAQPGRRPVPRGHRQCQARQDAGRVAGDGRAHARCAGVQVLHDQPDHPAGNRRQSRRDTLQNLGMLMRRREQMKLKIKAMSSEARASAHDHRLAAIHHVRA